MATADVGVVSRTAGPVLGPSAGDREPRRLHRIRTIRLREGVSLRSAARQMGSDIRSLRLQERESTDLRISELRQWQKALNVPLSELLAETEEPLSRPVLERARLVRLMKTAAAIREQATSIKIQRMAQMLTEQLIEIMPELKEVNAWHTYGQRRGQNEFGRIVERQLSSDWLPNEAE